MALIRLKPEAYPQGVVAVKLFRTAAVAKPSRSTRAFPGNSSFPRHVSLDMLRLVFATFTVRFGRVFGAIRKERRCSRPLPERQILHLQVPKSDGPVITLE